jgi:hypothetical protein
MYEDLMTKENGASSQAGVSLFPELNYDETAGMADRPGGGGGGLACPTLR